MLVCSGAVSFPCLLPVLSSRFRVGSLILNGKSCCTVFLHLLCCLLLPNGTHVYCNPSHLKRKLLYLMSHVWRPKLPLLVKLLKVLLILISFTSFPPILSQLQPSQIFVLITAMKRFLWAPQWPRLLYPVGSTQPLVFLILTEGHAFLLIFKKNF